MYIANTAIPTIPKLTNEPIHCGYEMTIRPKTSKNTGGDLLFSPIPSSVSDEVISFTTTEKTLSPERWMLPSGIRSAVSAFV